MNFRLYLLEPKVESRFFETLKLYCPASKLYEAASNYIKETTGEELCVKEITDNFEIGILKEGKVLSL